MGKGESRVDSEEVEEDVLILNSTIEFSCQESEFRISKDTQCAIFRQTGIYSVTENAPDLAIMDLSLYS
jgi:hypothetical protein